MTAKIDFSMMVLLDIIKKGLQGNDFKCRQVLPTSGHRSCSVWDVPDIKVRIVTDHPRGFCAPAARRCMGPVLTQSFQEWLDETMEANCESEVFEVAVFVDLCPHTKAMRLHHGAYVARRHARVHTAVYVI